MMVAGSAGPVLKWSGQVIQPRRTSLTGCYAYGPKTCKLKYASQSNIILYQSMDCAQLLELDHEGTLPIVTRTTHNFFKPPEEFNTLCKIYYRAIHDSIVQKELTISEKIENCLPCRSNWRNYKLLMASK